MGSSQSRQDVGFPSNTVKGLDFRFAPGCGGSGAGICIFPASYSYIYWPVKVNPFSRRNNLLVLRDDDWLPYNNGGFDGICANSNGTQRAFDIYLLYQAPTSSLNPALATGKITVPAGAALPLTLEFLEAQLPQPTNVLYERRIWVAVDLRDTGVMTQGVLQTAELFQTVKLNYEGTP